MRNVRMFLFVMGKIVNLAAFCIENVALFFFFLA